MLDRRHFLIGAGALLTASFVRRASAFSQKAGGPLILPSVRKPEETLYVYMQDYEFDDNDEVAEYDAKWRVSLGPDQPFAPPPPTWREHLRSLGHRLETHDETERVCREHGPASGRTRRPLEWIRVGGQLRQRHQTPGESAPPAQGPRSRRSRVGA